MAVFAAFMRKEFKVVRIKNRFAHDDVERVTVERLQAEFYAAEMQGEDTESTSSSGSGLGLYDRNYRDLMLNVEIPTSDGAAFICEVQVTLSGITILKKSRGSSYNKMLRHHRPCRRACPHFSGSVVYR